MSGILSAIGNTPLIELKRVIPNLPFRLFAKMEGFNPGGSAKDRSAKEIIEQSLVNGQIEQGITTVVESSSGNQAIGLAQVCAYYRLPLICVLDPKTNGRVIDLLKAYGAIIEMVEQRDPETDEFLPARLARVASLLREHPTYFWPNQYENEFNARAHWSTMAEIRNALDGRVDTLFCAMSTCGTLRGCREYVREHRMNTRIIGVDAEGSVILGGPSGSRQIPGMGAAIRPKLFDPSLIDEHLLVSDLESVIGCRRLIRREAILAGGSSGGVIMAIERFRDRIPPGTNCVAILPDRGERYLDTIYRDEWVREHIPGDEHLRCAE